MLTVSKGDRRVAAMVLNSAVNDVRGIVQCLVPGCEAHIVLMCGDGDPAGFVEWFMMTHDCDPQRYHRRMPRMVVCGQGMTNAVTTSSETPPSGLRQRR